MSRIKRQDIYPVKLNPHIKDYVVGSDYKRNGKTVNFEVGTLISSSFGLLPDSFMSGDFSWVENTLSFSFTELVYRKNGRVYSTPPTVVTLDNGGALPRKDIIAVTIYNELVVIKGQESVTPAEPSLPNTIEYLKFTVIDIAAGATVPTGFSTEKVFDEGLGEPTEWTTTENTGGTRIILPSTGDSNTFLKSIKIINPNITGDSIIFTNDVLFPVNIQDRLQLYIKLTSEISLNSGISISLYKSGVKISDDVLVIDGLFNFNAFDVSGYQLVSVPLSSFILSDAEYDVIRFNIIGFNNDNKTFYIDTVNIASGLGVILQGLNHSELTLDDGTNPHGTNKGDVGLSEVDNTSDINKPVSNATQEALDLKTNQADFEDHINNLGIHYTQEEISITESQISDFGEYEPVFNKNTAFNKNFGTTIGTVAEGNDSRINNGQTAFGWGNHALVGYLTSFTETDPVFTASQAFNIDSTDITNLSNLSGINTGDQDLSSYITKVGVPVDNQIGIWTGDGSLEGDSNLTWSGTQMLLTNTESVINPAIQVGTNGRDVSTWGQAVTSAMLFTTVDFNSFADMSIINLAVDELKGYGSFDASPKVEGTFPVDHLFGYQSRVNYGASGTMPSASGKGIGSFYSYNTVSDGVVPNAYGLLYFDVIGAGVVENQYGVYINPLTKGTVNNYGIYSDNENYLKTITSTSFVKSGGTSSQFLKADGSVDSNTYWYSGNDGSGSGLDADLLRGVHWGNINTPISSSSTLKTTSILIESPSSSSITEYLITGISRWRVGSDVSDNSRFIIGRGSAWATGKDISVDFSTGNVGIGNTNNTYKLDVSGTGRFTGDLTIRDLFSTRDGVGIVEIIGISSGCVVGTNTDHDLLLRRNNIERARLTSTGVSVNGVLIGNSTASFSSSVTTGVFTVATLPTGTKGARAFVSDANASTFNTVAAGGGANNVPVFHDGTTWRIG